MYSMYFIYTSHIYLHDTFLSLSKVDTLMFCL